MTTTFVSNDGDLAVAGYTSATNSLRTQVINPRDQKGILEPIVDVTNGTDATYEYFTDMQGFLRASWQFVLDCDAGTVTCTLEISNNKTLAPGSIPAAEWHDATSSFFGVASLVCSAAPTTDYWIENTGAIGLCKWAKIKVVANTTANTGDWKILMGRIAI